MWKKSVIFCLVFFLVISSVNSLTFSELEIQMLEENLKKSEEALKQIQSKYQKALTELENLQTELKNSQQKHNQELTAVKKSLSNEKLNRIVELTWAGVFLALIGSVVYGVATGDGSK